MNNQYTYYIQNKVVHFWTVPEECRCAASNIWILSQIKRTHTCSKIVHQGESLVWPTPCGSSLVHAESFVTYNLEQRLYVGHSSPMEFYHLSYTIQNGFKPCREQQHKISDSVWLGFSSLPMKFHSFMYTALYIWNVQGTSSSTTWACYYRSEMGKPAAFHMLLGPQLPSLAMLAGTNRCWESNFWRPTSFPSLL